MSQAIGADRHEMRFAFGANWRRFLRSLSDARIAEAERSIREMLRVESLEGKRILDAGCGSGLFSLAARRIGATVFSFDYDPDSVACTKFLRERYAHGDSYWAIEQGSVLDETYIERLGKFDVVYAWGVLHHTGNMRQAISNVSRAVANGGILMLAIYNDQGLLSRFWRLVKISYNQNRLSKILTIAIFAPYLVGLRYLVRLIRGRVELERGMSLWYDMLDWLGGYPFEVASPETIVDQLHTLGFTLTKIRTVRGRNGCNEFVVQKMG